MTKRGGLTSFGRTVRMHLAELDMHQKDLAQALGVSEAYLSYLLCGKRPCGAWEEQIRQVLDAWKKNEMNAGQTDRNML